MAVEEGAPPAVAHAHIAGPPAPKLHDVKGIVESAKTRIQNANQFLEESKNLIEQNNTNEAAEKIKIAEQNINIAISLHTKLDEAQQKTIETDIKNLQDAIQENKSKLDIEPETKTSPAHPSAPPPSTPRREEVSASPHPKVTVKVEDVPMEIHKKKSVAIADVCMNCAEDMYFENMNLERDRWLGKNKICPKCKDTKELVIRIGAKCSSCNHVVKKNHLFYLFKWRNFSRIYHKNCLRLEVNKNNMPKELLRRLVYSQDMRDAYTTSGAEKRDILEGRLGAIRTTFKTVPRCIAATECSVLKQDAGSEAIKDRDAIFKHAEKLKKDAFNALKQAKNAITNNRKDEANDPIERARDRLEKATAFQKILYPKHYGELEAGIKSLRVAINKTEEELSKSKEDETTS